MIISSGPAPELSRTQLRKARWFRGHDHDHDHENTPLVADLVEDVPHEASGRALSPFALCETTTFVEFDGSQAELKRRH